LRSDLLARGELTVELRDRLEKAEKQDEGGKALDLTGEMLRQGNARAANDEVRHAVTQAGELRQGIERAAGSVLGDDAEQLKLARSELDQLTDQLRREMQNANGAKPSESRDGPPAGPSDSEGRPASPSQPQREQIANTPNSAKGRSRSANQTNSSDQSDPSDSSPKAAGPNRTADARNRRPRLDTLLNGNAGGGDAPVTDGPLTGEDFGNWNNRLRDVEQLLDTPALRDAVAGARERVRGLRQDYAKTRQKPDWTVVQLQVLRPLVEVRDRLTEELARRENPNALVPIDHDPVPNRFAESVRRYYEELGKGGNAAQPKSN
jgi:hypothetical protein